MQKRRIYEGGKEGSMKKITYDNLKQIMDRNLASVNELYAEKPNWQSEYYSNINYLEDMRYLSLKKLYLIMIVKIMKNKMR